MSVVVSGDFCRLKLALPSLLFLSKDEVKAAHFDFDRCSRPLFTTVVHDRCSKVVCVPKILLIGIFLSHTFRSKIIAPSIPKLSTHSAGNERFGSAFPSSLLSGYALNKQTGHGRGRNLGRRSIFTLTRVVRSTNVQYSPHRTETPRFDLIQDSDVKVEKS